MSFWRWLRGDSAAKHSKMGTRVLLVKRVDSEGEWNFLRDLKSERATYCVTYRGCEFAVSRDRVLQGFKLREISEQEYIADHTDPYRPLSRTRKSMLNEEWIKGYKFSSPRGREHIADFLRKGACNLVDAQGLLHKVWKEHSYDWIAFDGLGQIPARRILESQSGYWEIWWGYEVPDDRATAARVSSPPLPVHISFVLANEPKLPPEAKLKRVLDCLPLIRPRGRGRVSRNEIPKEGRVQFEEIVDSMRALIIGGHTPPELRRIYNLESVRARDADDIFVTPYEVIAGPSIDQYVSINSLHYGRLCVSKAIDGRWLIDRYTGTEWP